MKYSSGIFHANKWGELMQENAEDLAILISLENGKPIVESRGEVLKIFRDKFLDEQY